VERIKHVQRVWKGDRLHLYFRKGDYREGPLASPDGSDELRAEVQAILERLAATEAAQAPRAGTVGAMLREYNRAPDAFLAKARSTQAEYQRLIDELIEDIGDVLLSEVSPLWLRELRSLWAARGYKAANDRRQVLKNALAPAVEDDRITGDPFAKVKKLKPPRGRGESRLAWQAHEVEAAIAEAERRGRHGLARAIGLGAWGGFRRGTICAIPLNARQTGFDELIGEHRRLNWITEKRHVLCDKREDPRLTALIDRTPSKATTIAYNAEGRPWKPRQLNQAIDRLMAALAKAGKVRGAQDESGAVYCPLTIHGLRHARGVELAENGASDAEIMAQLEHASDRQAKEYRRQASRRKLADAAQDRVDNVVKLRAKRTGAELKL
jgi:integrase